METQSKIFFIDKNLQKEFAELSNGKTEEQELFKHLNQAFQNLMSNAYCGIQIPKKLIPEFYIKKYIISNLWKYDLPRGWRLIYAIGNEGIEVLSVILEWIYHKDYEKRFNY
jgi:Txe/YoeB family toxin of Txe-Axe toxin-antitoxin module